MPQNQRYAVGQAWVMVTDANVSSVTFQNLTQGGMFISATNGLTAPTNDDGAISYGSGQGERNVLLSDLFPGVTGANRLWARIASGTGTLFISHA